jgi:hypothetical protein
MHKQLHQPRRLNGERLLNGDSSCWGSGGKPLGGRGRLESMDPRLTDGVDAGEIVGSDAPIRLR